MNVVLDFHQGIMRPLSPSNEARSTLSKIQVPKLTMLGANLSDQIPGGPNLTLTLTLNSNWEFSGMKPDTDIVP